MNEKQKQRVQDRHTRDDEAVQKEAMRRLLSKADGRRLVWGMLAETGLFENPHTGNALDTAFRSGMMSIGQAILARIEAADKRSFLQMQEENMQINEALEGKLAKETEDEYATDDS
jgi:hypothetical protein